VRLFVAAQIPQELRARLGRLQDVLRSLPLPVRWTRPEGVHLTLRFLGEVGIERLELIAAVLRPVAGSQPPLALEAVGVGTFPQNAVSPRVIWVGIRGEAEAAVRLQGSIDGGLETIGFAREERPFRPHLTLGRARGPARGSCRPILERYSSERLGSFRVGDIVLFESRLSPEGPSYRPIERFPLGGESER